MYEKNFELTNVLLRYQLTESFALLMPLVGYIIFSTFGQKYSLNIFFLGIGMLVLYFHGNYRN